jgi:hypothetical protein
MLFEITREKINEIHVPSSINCHYLIRVYHVIINYSFHCTDLIKSKIFKLPLILRCDLKLKVMLIFRLYLFLDPQHILNLFLCLLCRPLRLLFVLVLGALSNHFLLFLIQVDINFVYFFVLLFFFPLFTHSLELLIEDVDRATR